MIVEFHSNNGVEYNLDEEAEIAMKNERDAFTADINDAILDGETTPPKSKRLDLLPRLACTLHVLEYTLECALYLNYVEGQKHMLCEVTKNSCTL